MFFEITGKGEAALNASLQQLDRLAGGHQTGRSYGVTDPTKKSDEKYVVYIDDTLRRVKIYPAMLSKTFLGTGKITKHDLQLWV